MTEILDILEKLNFSRLLLSALVIALAVILWRVARGAFDRFVIKRGEDGRVQGVGAAVSIGYDVIKWLIVFSALLTVLEINGVNVGAMVAGFGIASAIVGLAFQDLLKDVIMGVHIMADDFFRVGDVIRYGDIEGRVISYNIRTTKLQDIVTGNILTVCNRNITEIVKLSELLPLDIPLPYEEDSQRAGRVLRSVADELSDAPSIKRCDYMGTQSFADSAVLYRLHLYCAPEQKPAARRLALRLVQEALEREDMRVPYPQLDVHTK